MSKTLYITDPCYILPGETWLEVVNKYNIDSDIFKALEKELEKISGAKAYVSSTGFGDWVNEIYSEDQSKIINPRFCADSGLVCVCEVNEVSEECLKQYTTPARLCAKVEVSDNYTVELDHSDPSWTVVIIKDENNKIHSCIPYDEDDEEEDF